MSLPALHRQKCILTFAPYSAYQTTESTIPLHFAPTQSTSTPIASLHSKHQKSTSHQEVYTPDPLWESPSQETFHLQYPQSTLPTLLWGANLLPSKFPTTD